MSPEKTKVDWDKFKTKFMNRDDIVRLCKDSDYDTDGGFWDNVGDWVFGENFDYASLEKSLTNFFNCCKDKLMKVPGILMGQSLLQAHAKTNEIT